MSEEQKIRIDKILTGKILDIGGGGEGVISRVYRQQVTAIDTCQEELDEAPDICAKLLMDATSLSFGECTFDHVTAFYSLMYMSREEQKKAIQEVYRVLKQGGTFHIWDAVIPSAYPVPFNVDLEVDAAGTIVHTTYGIVKRDTQNLELFIEMCRETGLVLSEKSSCNSHFYLRFFKCIQQIPVC